MVTVECGRLTPVSSRRQHVREDVPDCWHVGPDAVREGTVWKLLLQLQCAERGVLGNAEVCRAVLDECWAAGIQRRHQQPAGAVQLRHLSAQPNRGRNTAVDRTFTTTVTNGDDEYWVQLVVDNAKIGAIEIVQNTAPPPTRPVRVNAGGSGVHGRGRSSRGRLTRALSRRQLRSPTTSPIAGRQIGRCTRRERLGKTSATDSVCRTGVLGNAEVCRAVLDESLGSGCSTWDQQQQVLSNFDILAQPNSGPNTAVDKTFTTTVTNGAISIAFNTVSDNAKIGAIEIVPTP